MTKGLIHHLEIYVSNLQKSTEFWGWLLGELGYVPFQSWEGGSSFKQGETYLTFVQTEDRFLDIPYHRCRTGLNHLAFHLPDRGELDALTEKLKDRGTNILYADRHPHAGGPDYYAVFFEDPDRIKVELVAK
ncbi:MAG: VOC family protein [Turicibacter sp.]|nr:VOC family protein [Turicibacter sp.]